MFPHVASLRELLPAKPALVGGLFAALDPQMKDEALLVLVPPVTGGAFMKALRLREIVGGCQQVYEALMVTRRRKIL